MKIVNENSNSLTSVLLVLPTLQSRREEAARTLLTQMRASDPLRYMVTSDRKKIREDGSVSVRSGVGGAVQTCGDYRHISRPQRDQPPVVKYGERFRSRRPLYGESPPTRSHGERFVDYIVHNLRCDRNNITYVQLAICARDLPTLEDRRVQLCLNFARKVLRSQDFQHWLPPRRGTTTERTTRSSNKLTLTKCRTER
ncbi:hypothetical protein Bbelb_415540 [Branchiostoma belcheri]|nr:hypothetical protein Bbelb_415540 [Branchiostoma belcheri]